MWTRIAAVMVGGLVLATSVASAQTTFWYMSSIACDPVTGVCGWATGFLYTQQSVAAAKQACRDHGGQQCKIAMPSFDSCGAVTDPLKGGYYGIGQTKQLAISRALDACKKDGGRDCKVIVALCSEAGQTAGPNPQPSHGWPNSPRCYTGPTHMPQYEPWQCP